MALGCRSSSRRWVATYCVHGRGRRVASYTKALTEKSERAWSQFNILHDYYMAPHQASVCISKATMFMLSDTHAVIGSFFGGREKGEEKERILWRENKTSLISLRQHLQHYKCKHIKGPVLNPTNKHTLGCLFITSLDSCHHMPSTCKIAICLLTIPSHRTIRPLCWLLRKCQTEYLSSQVNLSLVPRLLPSFLWHTVQYATKSWRGAWERGQPS